MVSFRQRVLDALDIQKKTVKLQVNERFPKIYNDDIHETNGLELDTNAGTELVDYVVSKQIIGPETMHYDVNIGDYNKSGVIGPSFGSVGGTQYQTLDVLGFVVGNEPSDGGSGAVIGTTVDNQTGIDYLNTFPKCTSRTGANSADRKNYSGFWHLNGIYDAQMMALRDIRKSAVQPTEYDTQFPETDANAAQAHSEVPEHSHKDWPDSIVEQFHLLNEDKWADSLYYGSMKLQLLINGITIPDSSEKASNHRGLVRMLVLRPKIPTAKVRWTGDGDCPVINMAYPPHFDTDLFFSGKKTLAGRLDKDIERDTQAGRKVTHLTPKFGLERRCDVAPEIDVNPQSIHYGHPEPNDGDNHDLNAYDIISSPINRDAYSVIVDKTFTLDTRHHGAAAQRLENVTIPINKRIRFAGRLPNVDHSIQDLTANTNNEPLNLKSRPIIMFLSMDQKISCQVTGYTPITET